MNPYMDKDYRFLLSRLIPRHLLSVERDKAVSEALSSNTRSRLVRQAYLAMEELSASGIYEKEDKTETEEGVLLSYREKGGRVRLTMKMTSQEWSSIVEGIKASEGILPSVLVGILSSLTLNDSGVTTEEKIEEMLGLAGAIVDSAESYLIIFNESFTQGLRESELINESGREEIESSPLYGRCLSAGRIHTLIDPKDIPEGESRFDIGAGTGSVILMPLSGEKSGYGILQLHLEKGVHADNSALFNIYLIGQGIVRLLENNQHLEEMVSVDRLTNVNNRSYYETQLPLEMERATRNKKCFGFLMMDIDDFKKFNDLYGHDTGDEVLKLVAQAVRNHLRKIDLFFRYGGEEFIAILPGAGREASERTAERIREVVSKASLDIGREKDIGITITVGGCIYPVDADNEKELFKKADRMLLEAKIEGKNRVKFFKGTSGK